ncbi:MAG: hypothetical protein WBU92_11055 [Candidatus Dormiibacterota bacterium]
MSQGSDPRRRPDQQSSEPNGPPAWWMTLWQDRLPREADEPAPPLTRGLLGWAQRLVLALVPLLVVAAVVLGGFRLDLAAGITGGAAAAIVLVAVGWPLLERSRTDDGSGWG